MAKQPVKQITAWSFSRWRDYEKCPLFARLKHVDRIKTVGNAAMDRGSAIHKLAENYAGGKLKGLPEELEKFKAKFAALRKLSPQCEQEWAFNSAWGRCGWFDSDTWCRIKVDVTYATSKEAVVIDHKTGRYKAGNEEYRQQLELYALGALLIYRTIKQVTCKLWFLDSGDEEVVAYTRADLPRLQKLWEDRTKVMLLDKRFAPTPNRGCVWCEFSKAKGGQCKF